jgi:hypothetical protein
MPALTDARALASSGAAGVVSAINDDPPWRPRAAARAQAMKRARDRR